MTDTSPTSIFVLSDPDHGGDEALGRAFNALALALELDQAGADVEVVFQGAGTRWPSVLANPTHPANRLYEAVRHTIARASCACAEVCGARETTTACGVELLKENPVAGTPSLASLRSRLDRGARVLTF